MVLCHGLSINTKCTKNGKGNGKSLHCERGLSGGYICAQNLRYVVIFFTNNNQQVLESIKENK